MGQLKDWTMYSRRGWWLRPTVSAVPLVSQLSSVTAAAANEVWREFRTVRVMVLLKALSQHSNFLIKHNIHGSQYVPGARSN